jgi:pimeloyl-ACP methyl ester carboxylesterase
MVRTPKQEITFPQWIATGSFFEYRNNLNIFYRVFRNGSKPWLTALHGFPSSSRDFLPLIEELNGNFNLLVFDFLGFGGSDKPKDHTYSMAEQADITEKLLQFLEIEKTHLLAHDYGACVAQELLARTNETRSTLKIEKVFFLNASMYSRLHHPLFIQKALNHPLFGRFVTLLVSEAVYKKNILKHLSVLKYFHKFV